VFQYFLPTSFFQTNFLHPCLNYFFNIVKQRLKYYRKEIIGILAGRDKSQVTGEFRKRHLLHENQLLHFVDIDNCVQSYSYLFDAVLLCDAVAAEKFYRYLLDTDYTEFFFKLVAPKGLIIKSLLSLYVQ